MQGLNNRNNGKDDKLAKLDAVSKDNETAEKDTFGERIKRVRDRFKLGPHHRMERFSILFSVTAVFMVIFVVSGFFAHQSKVETQMASTAIVTDTFTYSLSGQKGAVEKVLTNKDHTDVIYLFRMRNIDDMSINTENYELFVTSEKRKGISYTPDMTFGFFGSTGYGFIRILHDEPIPQELLNVTIRANEKLTTGNSSKPNEEDGSFNDFDQARLFINPGAQGIEVYEGSDGFDTTDPISLYTSLIAKDIDNEIHEKIDGHLGTMENLLAREREYINRIESAGYIAPERPWFIEGDRFDEDGVYYSNNDVSYTHKINYQGVTITDGYLKQVMDGISDYDRYMADMNDARAERDDMRSENVVRITSVEKEDGTELMLDSIRPGTSPSAQIAVKDTVASLEGAWREYINAKVKLQRDLVSELLVLDADVLSQDINFSSITGSDYIIYY